MQLVYTLLFVNFCDVQVSDSPDETPKANAKITNVKQSLAMREIERFKEALMECGKLLWKNINIYIYIYRVLQSQIAYDFSIFGICFGHDSLPNLSSMDPLHLEEYIHSYCGWQMTNTSFIFRIRRLVIIVNHGYIFISCRYLYSQFVDLCPCTIIFTLFRI